MKGNSRIYTDLLVVLRTKQPDCIIHVVSAKATVQRAALAADDLRQRFLLSPLSC
jgi:hypothetical protein